MPLLFRAFFACFAGYFFRLKTNPDMAPKNFRLMLWRFARPLLGAYALAVVGIATFQRKLIYFPTKASEEMLLGHARAEALEPWRDEAGTLIGWRHRGQKSPSAARFLVFHGNAGYALHRVQYALELTSAVDCEVCILEYPGYGSRSGKPSQETLLAAGEQALRLLKKENVVSPIFLVGESLGTGVAAGVTARAPALVSGLILITPLNRMTDVASYHFPWLPVRWILADRYPAVEWLQKFPGPLAVVVAENDEVIPKRFGRALYDSFAGPKRLWVKPGMHNTIHASLDAGWWREATEFVMRP